MSILNLAQAAEKLGVSEKSIRRYIHAGRLPYTISRGKKGDEYRFESKDLDNLKKPERGRKKIQGAESREQRAGRPKDTKHSTNDETGRMVSAISPLDDEPELSDQFRNANQPPDPINSHALDAHINRDFIHIRQLIDEIKEKKRVHQSDLQESSHQSVAANQYQSLYKELLVKYENSLIKIGNLESEARNQEQRAIIREENYKKKIAEQEQLIQELYQIIRFYEQ